MFPQDEINYSRYQFVAPESDALTALHYVYKAHSPTEACLGIND